MSSVVYRTAGQFYSKKPTLTTFLSLHQRTYSSSQPVPPPLQWCYTLADQTCPYIIKSASPVRLPTHNLLDFELYPAFFNSDEQSVWMKFLLATLDRAYPRRRRQRPLRDDAKPIIQVDGFKPAETYDFEAGHFDAVITNYREHEIRQVDQLLGTPIQPLFARLAELLPSHTSLLAHILHLSSDGKIDSHLDHTSASGSTIVGLSLGSARVMHLLTDENATEPAYKVLLEPGSVYLQRDSVRYSLPHAIPQLEDFAGRSIGGSQRLSLVLRDKKA